MGGGCHESPPPFIGQQTMRMFSFSPTKREKDDPQESNSMCEVTVGSPAARGPYGHVDHRVSLSSWNQQVEQD